MTAIDKLIKAFANALEIPASEVNDDLQYSNHPGWDSTAHMILIAQLEAEFDVMFEVTDIIDMSSFQKAKQLLSQCDDRIIF